MWKDRLASPTRRSVAALALTIAVGALAVTPLATAHESTAVLTPQGLYADLEAAALRGDRGAAVAKEALDKYLHERGMTIADMPVPDEIKRSLVRHGALDLSVRDASPWFISISNVTQIRTPSDVDAYRSARHEALAALASDPDRMVVVVVTPSRLLGFAEFGRIIGAGPTRVVADVFVDGAWSMATGHTFDDPVDWEDIDRLLTSAAVAPPGSSDSRLRVTVRCVEVELPARDAMALAGNPSVLVVDSESDLREAFAGRAAIVSVSNPPDVFRVHAEAVLGVQLKPER